MTETSFKISNRWTGGVLYECELPADMTGKRHSIQLSYAVKKAISSGANLSGVVLRGAILSGANLSRANLRDADLSYANLSRANLSGADLSGADLRDTDLSGADLRDANLRDAVLNGANLSGVVLRGANLRDAVLNGADLQSFKQDLIAEVLRLPNELDALRLAIIEGRIEGSSYCGKCACLAGTLANVRGIESYSGGSIEVGGLTFHTDSSSPREQWFLTIHKGDTPENNAAAKVALEWVDEAIAIRENILKVCAK